MNQGKYNLIFKYLCEFDTRTCGVIETYPADNNSTNLTCLHDHIDVYAHAHVQFIFNFTKLFIGYINIWILCVVREIQYAPSQSHKIILNFEQFTKEIQSIDRLLAALIVFDFLVQKICRSFGSVLFLCFTSYQKENGVHVMLLREWIYIRSR